MINLDRGRPFGTVMGFNDIGASFHQDGRYFRADGTPVADAPVADAPVADAPVADAPVADAPVADAPVADAPVADAPVADAPVAGKKTKTIKPQTEDLI